MYANKKLTEFQRRLRARRYEAACWSIERHHSRLGLVKRTPETTTPKRKYCDRAASMEFSCLVKLSFSVPKKKKKKKEASRIKTIIATYSRTHFC